MNLKRKLLVTALPFACCVSGLAHAMTLKIAEIHPAGYPTVVAQENMGKKIAEATKGELDFVSAGSSLKFCLVAEGKADIYPRLGPTMEWDTAAGQVVAQCAGARIVNHETGRELRYNKESLLNPWFIVERI